ncbi:hypothetical protein Desor_3457 [Desulfosporosinus orientis DSM 765]|uniref:Uncharacterized protein n=1 Tax=Desulfosporosinus orientis (strain ATCC 19365 / DSM 765 / NCIMB 8382 / VKM B-1628 / Singapore I) TaxID=768706 RepID=G7WFS4_DESOD|nr:hypothetical protein Desor_3457 [Desulfosporosinus orientis DSM 765]
MGVCHYAVEKTVVNTVLPFPSVRMAKLFFEFLGRYREWKFARRQELVGMIIVILLGLLAVGIPWLFPKAGITVSIILLIFFYFAARQYIRLNERASHLYVNVHILHHHLLGKLEVGFCDHQEPCRCAEEFRDYALKRYHISFDSNTIK